MSCSACRGDLVTSSLISCLGVVSSLISLMDEAVLRRVFGGVEGFWEDEELVAGSWSIAVTDLERGLVTLSKL